MTDPSGAQVVGVSFGSGDFEIASWPLPADGTDPLASLVGWVAPDRFHALGLTVSGCRYEVAGSEGDRATSAPGRLRFTILLDRHGEPVLVGEDQTGRRFVGREPSGPVADSLHRCLARPTPPPDHGPGTWIEASWLDSIAEQSSRRPGHVTWSEASLLHPLSGGEVVEPESLALATMAAEDSTWGDLRQRHHVDSAPHPPAGTAMHPSDWFDDGSFARWVERDLPPIDDLLEVVFATVADSVAIAIMNALVVT
ncbi:MAG: hypothetical protein KDB02_07360 [Acidimicrobiales bacterium]|nr:hypothetical protein [Acidimicrobiales bacterium]